MVNGNQSVRRCLFISAHAPTKLYPQAGQKIALDNLEKYAAIADEIDIIAIANQSEINAASDLCKKFSKNLHLYPLSKLTKINNCLRNISIPLKFATRFKNEVAVKMQELLLTYEYDIIHFEYSHAAVYLELLQELLKIQACKSKSLKNQEIRIIISIHDIISHSFLRKSVHNPLLGIELARIFHYENKLYSAASKLWVLSEKDRNILTSLFTIPVDKIIVNPPKLSSFLSNIHREPEKIEPRTLLFWAAMNRPENERGIIIFVEKCFRKILEKFPDFKLYIVGYKPSKKILKLADKNIIVTGFVEDPRQFFEKAEIGIVPLLEGAGIKLKTLEMLHVNMPVISTSIGAEGIDVKNQYLLINNNFDEWVNLIGNITLSKC
ncbi:glycosyltransferase [Mastigocoleus testarum]|uniref:Group 1 glycosyl transferase n=1 Tax=Mastigocoleus testarum BC008 TaxID=371196 RepID=A0A0V7ZGE4_9CYAN|nr:glycosyltransferase [Mastigocoleus testarum]KST63648.1 group 1 glycosyl transferase [Mastigocoleus testarum BC008]